MHILVTNDDGPPSNQSSPYILPFVQTLEAAGHTVSVIVPDTQRSWIGKAHMVGQDVKATYYWPPRTNPETHEATSSSSSPTSPTQQQQQQQQQEQQHPWVLVNSTPASCAQLGLSDHFFRSRPKIDLVISGPNYGRNTSAVFALSSGTLGAALEAAVCGYRAIALSFAFFDRANLPDVVAESCQQARRVCEWLGGHGRWEDGRLYSVNVPVKRGVTGERVVWTRILQNQWSKGACFQEVRAGEGEADPNRVEAKVREGGDGDGAAAAERRQQGGEDPWREKHFKWQPRFTDVYDWVLKAGPGSDGWAVKEGQTSVTSIKANFMHTDDYEVGELKL